MSERLNELRLRGRNSCITMECEPCAKSPHTHTPTRARVHPHSVKYYYTIQSPPPERARMCASIFSNGRALGVVCVSDAMCQGSIMLRIQSDGP